MTEKLERDVVVVGYGSAGAVAAIEAARGGARVLLVEKLAHLGGNSILSAGYMRVAEDAEAAAAYLSIACGAHVPRPVVDVIARGMTGIIPYLEELARPLNANVFRNTGPNQGAENTDDLYDWPGRETFGWAGIESIPGFTGYDWMHFGKLGPYWMRVLESNVDLLGVEVWYETSATQLIIEAGEVVGVSLQRGGQTVDVYANGGVILTCGGFEFDEQLRRSFMEIPTIYPIGSPGNTGDGIRMALQAGASLWHPWHVHGSYGFKVPDFPVAFRNHLGGVRRNQRKVAWIIVDQQGRRFMNEVPVAPQDTGARPFAHLDSERGTFDRIPAWLIFDEAARTLGPIGKPLASVSDHYYEWSADNSEEIRRGWILQANSVEELAQKTALPVDNLRATLARWQQAIDSGVDVDFERPAGTFAPVSQPPFYAIQTWPVVTNTQGGPPHDEHHRVVNALGSAVPGLYAAGELGSVFGHIYLLGGNLAECLIGGRVAGQHAARRAAERHTVQNGRRAASV